MEAEGTPLPPELLKKLLDAPAAYCFTHGGFSWTAAEFRACWFAAAALAKVTDGLLFDERSCGEDHGYSGADQGLLTAEERSTAYENEAYTYEQAWDISVFTGWEA